ncbi:hypothetical protein CEXT_280661 [Caerostris extrusa]|uniref:Uncharacterized protein n=1 Tax=Caerostris extrusa TaxID=172846 RepID=A0AAV4M3F6_CAEEX|nr:hypothetical protein CEXT_280661 [Caerostris extrusa]
MRVFITKSHAGTFRPETAVGIRCRNAKLRLTATVECELESVVQIPINSLNSFRYEESCGKFRPQTSVGIVGGTQAPYV